MEEFKIIKDFPNYSVSNYGNVKNNTTDKILSQPINTQGYAVARLCANGKSQNHKVHRLIASAFIENPDNKPCVDHIDNNKLNNDLSNLRWVTFRENSMNQKITIKNKSGVKGVSFYKKYNCWRAEIRFEGKTKHLGYFENIEDAKRVRQKYANEIFGEYTNILWH
jgi:hypothetical protein